MHLRYTWVTLMCVVGLSFSTLVDAFDGNQTSYVIVFNLTKDGQETLQQVNLTEQDYILSFYSALCENTTYYYELTYFANAAINDVQWYTFYRANLNSSLYSDSYQCQGLYLNISCSRMLMSSTCDHERTTIVVTFRATFLCNKPSIHICSIPGQEFTIKNLLEAQITQTTSSSYSTKHVTTATTANSSIRDGIPAEVFAVVVALLSAALIIALIVIVVLVIKRRNVSTKHYRDSMTMTPKCDGLDYESVIPLTQVSQM